MCTVSCLLRVQEGVNPACQFGMVARFVRNVGVLGEEAVAEHKVAGVAGGKQDPNVGKRDF